ncbi:TPA: DUF1493 family protein [Salmonella enterica subsp. enterica serovar Virchow]|nr:DUF1493 family protein [Salmonella enterica subsp. enterica serovar Newport]EIP7935417.1 DUF1493 family protein [Salmonella enterica subsp. enterica serovar Infantis]EIP9231301.1 DUF1493 family protein [Salmonella enterica]
MFSESAKAGKWLYD